MRIILTRAIATAYLGAIPKGSGLDVSVDVGRHLVERGFAVVEQGGETEGVADSGIIREIDEDGADEGYGRAAMAADSCSCSDGEDGPAG